MWLCFKPRFITVQCAHGRFDARQQNIFQSLKHVWAPWINTYFALPLALIVLHIYVSIYIYIFFFVDQRKWLGTQPFHSITYFSFLLFTPFEYVFMFLVTESKIMHICVSLDSIGRRNCNELMFHAYRHWCKTHHHLIDANQHASILSPFRTSSLCGFPSSFCIHSSFHTSHLASWTKLQPSHCFFW